MGFNSVFKGLIVAYTKAYNNFFLDRYLVYKADRSSAEKEHGGGPL
jgi:hypothetical protein